MGSITPLQIAEHVVASGFASQHEDLTALYGMARRYDVSEVLLEVVADELEPRPVRERALGRIVVKLHQVAA